MSFPYKHILVIGATSGIGRAMAERLVENGAKVIVVGRRKDRLDAFVSKYGENKAQSMIFDITQTDKIPEFVKEITTNTGTNLAIVPAAPIPAYSASKTALNVFVLSLHERLKQSSKLKVIEASPPAVQTELHDYMGAHGATIGMPLEQFIDEALGGLQKGLDQVIVGNVVDNETFHDIVQKRRS